MTDRQGEGSTSHDGACASCYGGYLPLCLSLPSSLSAGITAGEDGPRDSQPISDLHAYAFSKLIFHNPKKTTCFCHTVC